MIHGSGLQDDNDIRAYTASTYPRKLNTNTKIAAESESERNESPSTSTLSAFHHTKMNPPYTYLNRVSSPYTSNEHEHNYEHDEDINLNEQELDPAVNAEMCALDKLIRAQATGKLD